MKEVLRIYWFLLFLFLVGSVVHGQVQTANFGDPIYWDANTEPDVDEYGVFRSNTPCTDTTPSPVTCPNYAQVATVAQGVDPINWIEPGPIVFVQDYYYRVTARNTSGNESQFSNELNVRWLNPDAPSAPGDLRKLEQGARMWIDWDDPDPLEHVAVWNVYKSTQEEELGAMLAMVGETEYRDRNRGRRGPRYYNVTAVNDEGVESLPAGPVIYQGKGK